MFRREIRPEPNADEETWDATEVDQSRLRAALRLVFSGETADQLVARAGATASANATAARVIRVATRQWVLILLSDFIRRRGAIHSGDHPLAPRRGMPARGAVRLALYLGLGLTIEALTEATQSGADQLGAELYRVRLGVEPEVHPACASFVSLIGRYRDGSLDLNSRASLLRHAQRCKACRTALDRFQALDNRLLAQIERERVALPAMPTAAGSRWMALLAQPVAVIIGLLAIVIVGLGVHAIVANHGRHNATATPASHLSGWLLTADSGGSLMATDLATGHQRPVGIPGSNASISSNGSADVTLSPDHRLIARLQGVSIPGPLEQEIEIDTLDGSRLKSFTFASSFGQIVGWLGNDTVLVISHPEIASTDNQDAYVARLKNESAILSFNITTGEQHQLFKGSVAQAYLSPDDTMIAMVATFAQVFNQPLVFQLRPIQNSLVGEPVTSIPNGVAYAPVWAPDSSHLYLGIERDAAATAIPGQPNATPDTGVVLASTISVDRAGIVTALPQLPESISDFPIDVSPDGQRLFRAALSQSGQSPDARLWQSTTSGTQPHPLTKPSAYRFSKFAWSPGGETAVGFAQQPFLLQPTANNNALGDISVASLIAINQDGTSFPVISRMNEALGTNVIGWLPENAFPSTAPSELPSQLSEPTPVDLNQFNGAIDSGSQASPDGRYIVMTNHDTNQPVVWSHAVSLGRSLPPETHDLSWFPDSQVLIGVGNSSGTQQGGPSRISTFVPAFSVSLPTYDFRSYDPAAIGSSSEKQYALPLISPDENALAFFVTDARDRSTSLWLVSYARQPELITSWSAPPDGRIALAPLGGWANANSFIFAEPAKWQNGLPDEVQLNRLTVERDGNARIDTVTKLQTHGTEHGVALEELAVSMQSGRLAYRLRHFARASVTDGVTDTVEIASGNKIADALEVTRRGAAIGLSWSPDGEILAAVSPDELDLFSGSGTLLGSLVGLKNAANPRWINQNQIWFDERTNQGDRVMSVHLK